MKKVLLISIMIIIAANLTKAQSWLIVDQGNPDGYQTIHDAVSAAADGDTIFVTPGQYVFDATLGVITITKKLAIIGAGYDEDGTHLIDQTGNGFFILDGSSDDNYFTGFKMKGAGTHINIQSGAKSIVIEKNYFIQTGAYNIYSVIFSGTEDDTIRYNYFFSSGNGSGLALGSTKGDLINNNIFVSVANGLSINNSDVNDRVLVLNNLFLECGLYVGYNNFRYALSVNTVVEVYNNIFMNNVYGVSATGNPIIKYNGFFNNSISPTAGYFMITEDPLFEDYSAGDVFIETSIDDEQYDFNLQETSPMVDAGILGYYFDVDGSRADISLYGGPWPMPGGKGEPTIPVVISISVTPTSVSPSGTISISATGRIGEEAAAKSGEEVISTPNINQGTNQINSKTSGSRERDGINPKSSIIKRTSR